MPDASIGFHADSVAALLHQQLGVTTSALRLRYLEYRPGARFLAQWRASVDGTDQLFVISVGWVPSTGRSLHASMFPADPVLRIGATTPSEVLAWVPYQRAAIRRTGSSGWGDEVQGGVVEKFYATDSDVDAAMRAASVNLNVRTAPIVSVDRDRRCVAQQLIPGSGFDASSAVSVSFAAGQLLQTLHSSPVADVPVFGPAELLGQCAAVVDLVSFALPVHRDRLAAVQRKLTDVIAEFLPDFLPNGAGALVTSHGDFNAGQLIGETQSDRVPHAASQLTLVDLDTLCRAPRALDVAAYVTNVMSGRVGDDLRALDTLDNLKTGYGSGRIEHLDWFLAATLLRRCDRALRRAKKDWPDRTERLILAVETFAERLS